MTANPPNAKPTKKSNKTHSKNSNSHTTKPKNADSKPELPRIKIFQMAKKHFATIGISPQLVAQAYPLNEKISTGLLIIGTEFICLFVYIFNEAEEFVEYTQSICMCSLVALVNVILLVVMFKVEIFFYTICECQDIVNTTFKYSASNSVFNETNQLIEKLSEITFMVMVKLTPACIYLSWLILTLLVYFTTDSGKDAFELPFPMWLPFDWRNPLGFLIAMTMQFIMFFYTMMIGACTLALSFGFYLFAISESKCIKGSLFAINQNAKTKDGRKMIREQLIEFIKFHSHVKQSMRNFSEIFQHILTVLFLWSLITICGALLMIQTEITNHSDDIATLSLEILTAIYGFGVLFIACELCQRVNYAYAECSYMIDQLDWYKFSAKDLKILPIIITFTQKPYAITCFGSTTCDREEFKEIIKTAFSYFMMLRQFYNK